MKSEHPPLFIRPYRPEDAPGLLELRLRNQAFFQAFEPIRPASHYTLEAQQAFIAASMTDFESGTAYAFGVFLQETGELIGRVALSNVVRGAWQNATLGYSLDQRHNGKGYMTIAVRLALQFAFEQAGLHRVQAAVMPRNSASIRVLEKAGFRREGLSLRYLQINGVWEDHLIFAVTAEEWPVRA
jgi:ribosomal-protein-alanine N-acetyltransferase